MEIIHNKAEQRIETEVEGYNAHLDYTLTNNDKVINILHTWVPPQIGGKGIAADLTRFAFEYAKANGLKVTPTCPYTQVFLQRYPEYYELSDN